MLADPPKRVPLEEELSVLPNVAVAAVGAVVAVPNSDGVVVVVVRNAGAAVVVVVPNGLNNDGADVAAAVGALKNSEPVAGLGPNREPVVPKVDAVEVDGGWAVFGSSSLRAISAVCDGNASMPEWIFIWQGK